MYFVQIYRFSEFIRQNDQIENNEHLFIRVLFLCGCGGCVKTLRSTLMTEAAINSTLFTDFSYTPDTMNAIPKDLQLPLVVLVCIERFNDVFQHFVLHFHSNHSSFFV
jgi:hypothetical protein